MDLNKAMVIGRLTRDPESKATQSNQTLSSFSVATNYTWTDAAGQKQEKVEFHNIVAWRKLADICNQYLKKGSRVYIEGRIQTRTWQDQAGAQKNRTEIIAENMIMLDSRGAGTGAPFTPRSDSQTAATTANPASASLPTVPAEEEIRLEDIPF